MDPLEQVEREVEQTREPGRSRRRAEAAPRSPSPRGSATSCPTRRCCAARPRATAPTPPTRTQVAKQLVETLGHFGIEAKIVGRVTGPRVTRHELRLAPGTKVSKVTQLKDDIAYALASTDIRILAPIPGKQAVGVEVPNKRHRMVYLGDIFRRDLAQGNGKKGRPASPRCRSGSARTSPATSVWTDLARMPHLLVAGTTGSGKSGCVNTMLSSILLRSTPNEVRHGAGRPEARRAELLRGHPAPADAGRDRARAWRPTCSAT